MELLGPLWKIGRSPQNDLQIVRWPCGRSLRAHLITVKLIDGAAKGDWRQPNPPHPPPPTPRCRDARDFSFFFFFSITMTPPHPNKKIWGFYDKKCCREVTHHPPKTTTTWWMIHMSKWQLTFFFSHNTYMLNEDENVCWQRDICWTDALINLMNDLSSTTDVLHKPVMMIIRRHEAAHVTIFEHTKNGFYFILIWFLHPCWDQWELWHHS